MLCHRGAMRFLNLSHLLDDNPHMAGYGACVTSLGKGLTGGHDVGFNVLIAGYEGENIAYGYDGTRFARMGDLELADPDGMAVCICAADIDGDGREEIYIHNIDTFGGASAAPDRLLDYRRGRWFDLFTLADNITQQNFLAGRSVACVDRFGAGRYGFLVAHYGAPMRLFEAVGSTTGTAWNGAIRDEAARAGLGAVSNGRALVPGPFTSERTDIFCGTENGPHLFFKNMEDGRYINVAPALGLEDPHLHGRGAAAFDDDHGGLGLCVASWEGRNRFFIRTGQRLNDMAPPLMMAPGRVRNVVVADLDNCGHEEVFFHMLGQPNRLFAMRDERWVHVECGECAEPDGFGTGAVVGDFNGNGLLELLLVHGEAVRQPLSLFEHAPNDNNFVRILPLTRFGAPARGALVELTSEGRTQLRAIDGGSGYLCQQEPVAHFGLGQSRSIGQVRVTWPDGSVADVHRVHLNDINVVAHPESLR